MAVKSPIREEVVRTVPIILSKMGFFKKASEKMLIARKGLKCQKFKKSMPTAGF
jgi:hypothetical protein